MKMLLLKNDLKRSLEYLIQNTKYEPSYKTSGAGSLQEIVALLNKTDLFSEEITNFKTHGLFLYEKDEKILNSETIMALAQDMNLLRERVRDFLLILNKIAPEPQKYVISVQLPPNIDLLALPEFYRSLDRVLSTPMSHFNFSEHIKINSFENGSKLNDFFVENEDAFKFLNDFSLTATKVIRSVTDLIIAITLLNQVAPHIGTDNILPTYQEHLVKEASEKLVSDFSDQMNEGSNEFEVISQVEKSLNSYIKITFEGAIIKPILINVDDDDTEEFEQLSSEICDTCKIIDNQIKQLQQIDPKYLLIAKDTLDDFDPSESSSKEVNSASDAKDPE